MKIEIVSIENIFLTPEELTILSQTQKLLKEMSEKTETDEYLESCIEASESIENILNFVEKTYG